MCGTIPAQIRWRSYPGWTSKIRSSHKSGSAGLPPVGRPKLRLAPGHKRSTVAQLADAMSGLRPAKQEFQWTAPSARRSRPRAREVSLTPPPASLDPPPTAMGGVTCLSGSGLCSAVEKSSSVVPLVRALPEALASLGAVGMHGPMAPPPPPRLWVDSYGPNAHCDWEDAQPVEEYAEGE